MLFLNQILEMNQILTFAIHPKYQMKMNIDFNDTPKLPIINNAVDFATPTSNNMSSCSKFFIKKDYFVNFYNENLEFRYYVQSKLDGETQQMENKSDYETQIIKDKINYLEQEIINLKKINEDLRSHIKSQFKIIETLSERNPVYAHWQTTFSQRIGNYFTNR